MRKNILSRLGLSLLATAALTLSSCSPKTQLTLFENISTVESGVMGTTDYNLTIRPDDRLSIMVTSINPNASMVYNLPTDLIPLMDPHTGQAVVTQSSTSATYRVTLDGDINFPVLGKIHVAGMTTEELADYLCRRIAEDVENPLVTVTLKNFHINIMGEVGRPGSISSDNERFSILDAIARAGDFTQFAVRDNVLLVREENGRKEYHHLDLTDAKIFDSPYFYLQQNDLIYVQPNEVRASNASYNVNNAYRIQVTSAVISACSVVASLVIALAIK